MPHKAEPPASREELEKALGESQERLRMLTALSSDWYWEQDEGFRFTLLSDFLKQDAARGAEAHQGKRRWDTPADNLTDEDWARHKAQLERHEPFYDFEMQRPDEAGREAWVSISGAPFYDAAGRFRGYRGVGRDITAKKLAEKALRDSEARFRALTHLSADWYWEQDENMRFVALAGGSEGTKNLRPSGDIGKSRWELPGIRGVTEAQWNEHRTILNARKPFRDFEYQREYEGGWRSVSISGEPFFDAAGRFRGYRGIGRDITERKRAEERIQYLALHDGLTTLPNRANFNQLLSHALRQAQRHKRRLALLFIDLDGFKSINDTLGHDAGDQLLKEIALRLKRCLRASDMVARLGGDEFVVLMEEVPEPGDAATVAKKILSAVAAPVLLQGQDCGVTASIGVCMYPDPADSEQALVKNADYAMYQAKKAGKNACHFYSAADTTSPPPE